MDSRYRDSTRLVGPRATANEGRPGDGDGLNRHRRLAGVKRRVGRAPRRKTKGPHPPVSLERASCYLAGVECERGLMATEGSRWCEG